MDRSLPIPTEARGLFDRRTNSNVRAASANVAPHRFVDLSVGGFRFFREQRRRGHDLPRLTKAALRDAEIDPRFLQWMRAVGREPFDRRDSFAFRAAYGGDACTDHLAIDVDRARAAERLATSVFRAREPEDIA